MSFSSIHLFAIMARKKYIVANSIKMEESHNGVQIAIGITRFSILFDSFFFLCNYISNRRTIHAAGILHCNVHACIYLHRQTYTTRRVAHRRCEFHLTSSQLWRVVFPAGARNRESYSRTMKSLFLAKASDGTRDRARRTKGDRREKNTTDEWKRERQRKGEKEKKRKREIQGKRKRERERDKRTVRRKDSEHGR